MTEKYIWQTPRTPAHYAGNGVTADAGARAVLHHAEVVSNG